MPAFLAGAPVQEAKVDDRNLTLPLLSGWRDYMYLSLRRQATSLPGGQFEIAFERARLQPRRDDAESARLQPLRRFLFQTAPLPPAPGFPAC